MEEDLIENSNQNTSLIIDRFEGDFAVCERQDNEEMINIDKSLIPTNAVEGTQLKKCGEQYLIDYEDCIVTRKVIIDNLKNNWEKEESTEYYFVSAVLDVAVKCTNIFEQQNIYIKDEALIKTLKKGDIVKQVGEEFFLDEDKNFEVQNELRKLL